MAAKGKDMMPSGPGQGRKLAEQAAAGIATGEPITMAVKTASVQQLSCIIVFACAKSGFPTVNRHLYEDQLSGLGWQDLQQLTADPAKGKDALDASCKSCQPSPESWASYRWRLTVGSRPWRMQMQ